MLLDQALSVAAGGLQAAQAGLALVSQNVANAGTPGYAREVEAREALSAGGTGMGVRVLPATRALDETAQADLLRQNAAVAGLDATGAALAAIDAAQGTVGSGSDLGGRLGALADAFTTLRAEPDNGTRQQAVASGAGALAAQVRGLAAAYAAGRQAAQDALASDVGQLNDGLRTVGALSARITRGRSEGVSTADLENQRDAVLSGLSQLVDLKVVHQASGDVTLLAGGAQVLPTCGSASPVAVADATLGAGAAGPPVTLGGVDVGASLGGRIGANVALRDTVLPTFGAELDEFSHALATRFEAQGLRLFTAPDGTVPPGGGVPAQAGYVGFSAGLAVNPAVVADPRLVRDGTHAVAAGAPNPPGGPAGFAAVIGRVLDYALGAQTAPGVPQPAAASGGLGAGGTLFAPYAQPTSLGGMAAVLVAAQSATSADAASARDTEGAVQAALASRVSASSGVSVDAEMATMVALQSAYGANARVVAAAQAMWNQLLDSVRP